MRKLLLLASTLAVLGCPPVTAQGPGPGPIPSPWLVNGNVISYPGGVVVGAPTGSAPAPGVINVSVGYYVNGTLVSGLPPTASGHLICNSAGSTTVPIDCSWNTFASLAIGTQANSLPIYAGGAWGKVSTGVSVLNPGTGTLESVLPIQTVTQTSYLFVSADLYKETRRSNSGAAMTDTFPGTSVTGLVNGTRITYNNVDVTATATITAGTGTTMSNGLGSETVGPGRSIQYVYDASATEWRRTLNTGTALLGPNNLSDLDNIATARGTLIPSGTITNAQLVNSATSVNGQSCSLGGTCTITATAASITVGTTTVSGSPGLLFSTTSGGVLSSVTTANNGVLVTSGAGVFSISSALPSGLSATNMILTTPTLGAAIGTSLALGGATLGSNALAVTGTTLLGTTNIVAQNANALNVGVSFATPAFQVDSSATAQVTGLKVTGAASGGGVSLSAISSASNENLTINAKGTGTIAIGNVSTGVVTITPALTLGTALTGANGGTGANNGSNTITLAANVTHAGAFATTITATAITNSTFPAGTHTLAGLDVAQTYSGLQSYNDSDFALNGTTSGNLVLRAAAVAGSSIVRFPAGSTDFSATGGTGQYVKQTSSGGALTVAAIAAADLPLATNAAIGGMRGDGTTITCTSGVCTSSGSSAIAVTLLTTTVTGGTLNNALIVTSTGCSGTTPCMTQTPLVGSVAVTFITSTATYTPLTGEMYAEFEAIGGGGGSGGAADTATNQSYSGSGGGSGAYCALVLSASSSSGITITIGGGGAAGTASASGGSGGNTTVGACTAGGGGGGVFSSVTSLPTGGASGTASGGTVNISGSTGGVGVYQNASISGNLSVAGGYGGASHFSGSAASSLINTAGSVNGNPGLACGGGASGGVIDDTVSGTALGATGAAGCVKVTHYVNH